MIKEKGFVLEHLFYCLSIYLWLYWVFIAAQAFLQVQCMGATLVVVHGPLIVVASIGAEHRL